MPMARDVDAIAMLSGSGYGRNWRREKIAGWNLWNGWTLVEEIDPLGATEEDVARFVVHLGTEASPRSPAWSSAAELISTLLENPLPDDLRAALLELAARLRPRP